jgi:hypothetical protein
MKNSWSWCCWWHLMPPLACQISQILKQAAISQHQIRYRCLVMPDLFHFVCLLTLQEQLLLALYEESALELVLLVAPPPSGNAPSTFVAAVS